MRLLLPFAAIVLISFYSCTGKENDEATIPEAMQTTSEYASAYKRTPEDAVNSIYANLVKKSEELKALEEKLDELHEARTDSVESFSEFEARSDEYYAAAEKHAAAIKDSVAATRVIQLLRSSRSRFQSAIQPHTSLEQSINGKLGEITDLREELKILLTLPVIQEYEKTNLPPRTPLENLLKELQIMKNRLDSMVKKS